jgi:ABC-type cobalamin transport system permease subunit
LLDLDRAFRRSVDLRAELETPQTWSGVAELGEASVANVLGMQAVEPLFEPLPCLLAGVRAGHGALALGSTLSGAALVVGADVLVRTFEFSAARLPLGVVTSIVGGAAFISLLRSPRGSYSS